MDESTTDFSNESLSFLDASLQPPQPLGPGGITAKPARLSFKAKFSERINQRLLPWPILQYRAN